MRVRGAWAWGASKGVVSGALRRSVAVAAVLIVAAAYPIGSAAAAGSDQWVYYATHPGGLDCAGTAIWRMHLNGTDPQDVLPPAMDTFSFTSLTSGDTAGDFAVAPAGNLIIRDLVFPNNRGVQAVHLVSYNLITGAVRQLTTGDTWDQWPAISPNGKTVAFWRTTFHVANSSVVGGSPILYTMPVGGGRLHRVISNPADAFGEISWLPSGRTLLVGTELVSVFSGRTTQYVRGVIYYSTYALSSTWTSLGLLYVQGPATYVSPEGTSKGRPPSGLYLARRPGEVTGTLLQRYHYPENITGTNEGLYGISVVPDTKTFIGQDENRLVIGDISTQPFHVLRTPQRLATRPELADGPASLPTALLHTTVGAQAACAG